jgi:hypothetical protein
VLKEGVVDYTTEDLFGPSLGDATTDQVQEEHAPLKLKPNKTREDEPVEQES